MADEKFLLKIPRRWRRALALLGILGLVSPAWHLGAASVEVAFDLPEDLAERSLKRFSEQSGRQVLFAAEITRGVRTNRVRGEMPAADALQRMLVNTGLVAVSDRKGGAYSVRKETPEESKNGSWAAPTQGRRPRRLNPTFHPINPTRV